MLILRTLRDDWWKVLAYAAVLFVNAVLTVLSYPTFHANFEAVMNLVPDFLTPVKSALTGAGGGGLPVFVAINHLFKGANIVGAAVAILLALGTVVREVEIGTIGLLLSRPVSRARIFFTFVAVHLLELWVPLLLVTCAIPALAQGLIGDDLDEPLATLPLLRGAIHAAAFITVVYSLGMLAGVWLTEQLKVAAAVGGVCVVSFIIYFVDFTRPYSLFRLSAIEVYSALARGTDAWRPELFLSLGIAAAVLACAWLTFRKRDY